MDPEYMQIKPDIRALLERCRDVLCAHWQDLLRLRRALLKEPDAIHDLRVASRRFRVALELFGPLAGSFLTQGDI